MVKWIRNYIDSCKQERKQNLANLVKEDFTIKEGKDRVYIVCNGIAVDSCNTCNSIGTLLERLHEMRNTAKEYVANEN